MPRFEPFMRINDPEMRGPILMLMLPAEIPLGLRESLKALIEEFPGEVDLVLADAGHVRPTARVARVDADSEAFGDALGDVLALHGILEPTMGCRIV